jgi:hypothetical protein
VACEVLIVFLLGCCLIAPRKDNQNWNSGLRDGASVSGRLLSEFLALCGVGIELIPEERDRGDAKSVTARSLDDLAELSGDLMWPPTSISIASNPEALAKSSTSSIGRSLKVDV